MAMKKKALCKWSKSQYAKHREQLLAIVKDPTHICKDCGRVANEKKWLCKPDRI